MNSAADRRIRTVVAVSMLSMIIFGCSAMFPTPIKKILENPREYSGRTVTISGKVTEVVGLVFVQYFVVKDSTGEITVITAKPLPRRGSDITVKGKVQQAFAIGDRQLIVIVEKNGK